jgi:uncharacterized protein (DUF2126 family)/transglutaminase-like putative cysteine protease
MTRRVSLHHETEYRYDHPISLGPQLIRLRPAFHTRTPIDAYSLKVEPEEHFRNWQQDPFGNPVARIVFPRKCDQFKITIDLIADMTVINPFDFFIEEKCDQWPFEYPEPLRSQLVSYLNPSQVAPNFSRWIDCLPKQSDRIVDFLVQANQLAHERVNYLVRLEPGVQSPEETLSLGSGSCRDSAWLMVETFRQIGLASRFVSGYLIQLAADQKSLDGPSGPEVDFCDLHAWVEVYVPGAGWIGLDPTSGLLAGEGHIPLACSPSFEDAAPIAGGHEACEVDFDYRMSVERFDATPSISKPYSKSQWKEILRLGNKIDSRLNDQDVRLTMGGEPTFVSVDNMDDPQWNTEAVGVEKRVLSNLLLLRLRDQFAPGSLLHYGQGKWYPGESLPRWALSCIWRRDGEPIWDDPKWLADEGTDYGYTSKDADRFVRHLASELGIPSKLTFPVYEDTFHYLWRENRLPVDVDPTDPKLKDPNERAMMVRAFTSGLDSVAGYVMPIRRQWWQSQPRWIGGRWPIRGGRVFLLPGDSPIGLRLPMESLPFFGGTDQSIYTQPLDPTIQREPLPRKRESSSELKGSTVSVLGLKEQDSKKPFDERAQVDEGCAENDRSGNVSSEKDVVRTALCVECRYGRLHVFLPPTQRLEDYLDLVNKVEKTCEALQLAVVIEGYSPPSDDRIERFQVTPDPGVIEVNTQPTETWQQLVDLTEKLHHEARACRLGTDKFDLDGRHSGTGGGNHIVLGGRSPQDSPFLRRPDLLGSMIRFWNNHPSLSYLFSGKFVGPTSQAPRFDEGRRDAVYEMEISLQQIPDRHQFTPPWLVDRLFRDLLVDPTGNTHRSEICIDKLYSPDSTTGRLGLVELRAFEMPPHPQMSLTQQLLIRGIVAAFWERPYKRTLCNWQESLHDRFMLPSFVWRDFCEVIADLNEYGLNLNPSWFIPHHEFRFPMIGETHLGRARLTLRSAIEPWYVLGEEPGSAGTARYVDSSVERLELLVDGLEASRYRLLCNGHPLPMHPTGTSGQYVAGIRYRAWQPPRCLHPTIGIHHPLTFELYDSHQSLSVGGCTYHVVDPGGRGTERFPINSFEAESRRATRFEKVGFTGQRFDLPETSIPNSVTSYPFTFDLRRVNGIS